MLRKERTLREIKITDNFSPYSMKTLDAKVHVYRASMLYPF
jgi:hypothetical protein